MRQALLPMLAVAAATSFLLPISHAQAQRGGQVWCDPYRRCVTTTDQSYNACYTLAIQRGWSHYRFDNVGRSSFIYKCLTGRQR